MPHQRLLLKLKSHGIGNDVINWIEVWLTHSRQRVIVDGEISNWQHLEYCIQAWRPYRKKDIDKLARIKRRATKMLPELRDLNYESRL